MLNFKNPLKIFTRGNEPAKVKDTYRHDLLQVLQGSSCNANEGILVTWYSGWSQELPAMGGQENLSRSRRHLRQLGQLPEATPP